MLIDMQSRDNKPKHNQPCVFKCSDFTTEIVGRFDANFNHFYVQRGDGVKYTYSWGIEYFKELASV